MSPPFRIRTPCPRCLCLQEVPGLGDANRADPSAGADRDLGAADREQGHGYHSAGGGVDLAGVPDDGQSSLTRCKWPRWLRFAGVDDPTSGTAPRDVGPSLERLVS